MPVGDADALAEATAWALSNPDPMRDQAAVGRRRVAAEFSESEMIERTLALLAPGEAPRSTINQVGLEAT